MSPADVGPVFAASIFAALGDRTRLALVKRLADGRPRSIAALSADTGLSRQAVTKHLRVLGEAGLVGHLRVGRETRFAYRPGAVAEARSCLESVSALWDGTLVRLRGFVEGDC